MRLVSFEIDSKPRFGFARADGGLVEFADACAAAGVDAPEEIRDALGLIERWPALEGSRDVLRAAVEGDAVPAADPKTVRWLPPVPRPPKVFGIAANNKIAFESASFIEDHPVFFTEPTSALVGHDQPIVIYPHYGVTHTEAELGVVIGKRTKHATLDDAMDSVFGYTIMNDVTSPDLKSGDTLVFDDPAALSDKGGDGTPAPGFEHGNMVLSYHARSKGTDTFLPCGPWIATADEIADPHAIGVKAYLDGRLVTEDNTGSLKFTVAEVIVQISAFCTLEPGDHIHMGTAVTGPQHKLRDLDFQVFDGPTTLEFAGLGTLSNPIERRS